MHLFTSSLERMFLTSSVPSFNLEGWYLMLKSSNRSQMAIPNFFTFHVTIKIVIHGGADAHSKIYYIWLVKVSGINDGVCIDSYYLKIFILHESSKQRTDWEVILTRVFWPHISSFRSKSLGATKLIDNLRYWIYLTRGLALHHL